MNGQELSVLSVLVAVLGGIGYAARWLAANVVTPIVQAHVQTTRENAVSSQRIAESTEANTKLLAELHNKAAAMQPVLDRIDAQTQRCPPK